MEPTALYANAVVREFAIERDPIKRIVVLREFAEVVAEETARAVRAAAYEAALTGMPNSEIGRQVQMDRHRIGYLISQHCARYGLKVPRVWSPPIAESVTSAIPPRSSK